MRWTAAQAPAALMNFCVADLTIWWHASLVSGFEWLRKRWDRICLLPARSLPRV